MSIGGAIERMRSGGAISSSTAWAAVIVPAARK
jgi:hypothetical protein